MINLLPKNRIKQLHAAQQNTLLLRYVLAATATLGLVIAIHIATFALLKTAEHAHIATSQENQKEVKLYDEVRKNSEEYVANLKTARAIFNNKAAYPDAVITLANQLPEGIVLRSVSLDKALINEPTTLTADAKSYDAAIALKERLENSDIAKDVTIASTNNNSLANPEAEALEYPFTVVLNLTYTEALLKPRGEQ